MKTSLSMIMLALTALHGISSHAMPIEDELKAAQEVSNQSPSLINKIAWSLHTYHEDVYNTELWDQLIAATQSFINDSQTLKWDDLAYQTSFNNFMTALSDISDGSFHGSCSVSIGSPLTDRNVLTETNENTQHTYKSDTISVEFIIEQSEAAQHWDTVTNLVRTFLIDAQSKDVNGKKSSVELAKNLFAHTEYKAHLNVNIHQAS